VKRVKKTIPKIKIETIQKELYEIQCPHCKTYLRGNYNKQILRKLCSWCNNPVEIEWDKAVNVEHF